MTKQKREVTEWDFRKPEFRDAKPEDYELRDDGVPVRKDRWEWAVRSIASHTHGCRVEWEVHEVVNRAVVILEKWELALADTKRLEVLLPNLNPANFGLEYDRGLYEEGDPVKQLQIWREALDQWVEESDC